MNIWILLGGVNAALAVGAGAYGWHSLAADPDVRDIFMMGSQYQMWHAIAMIAVGLLLNARPSRFLNTAGWCFQIGLVLFSGSLYSYGEFMIIPIEGAAPFGGVLLMLGWLTLGVAGARHLTHNGDT
ncbi:DUF423 domain-containing protein [Pseudomonadota bacterium]